MLKINFSEASFGDDLVTSMQTGIDSYLGRKSTRLAQSLPEGMRRASSDPGIMNTKKMAVEQALSLKTQLNAIPSNLSQEAKFIYSHLILQNALKTVRGVAKYSSRLEDELTPLLAAATSFMQTHPACAWNVPILMEMLPFWLKQTTQGMDIYKDLYKTGGTTTANEDNFSKDMFRDNAGTTVNGKPIREYFETFVNTQKGWPEMLTTIKATLIAQGTSDEAKALIKDSLPLLQQNGFLGRAFEPCFGNLTAALNGAIFFSAPERSLELSLNQDPITVKEFYRVDKVIDSSGTETKNVDLEQPITLEHTFTITRGPDGQPKATTTSLGLVSPDALKVEARAEGKSRPKA